MRCVECDASDVSERTAQSDQCFRCRACGRQFNERSGGILNRAQYPSDVTALVVFWRLLYKLSLRDLSDMFLIPDPGIEFNYGAVRDWEAQLTPALLTAAVPLQGDAIQNLKTRLRHQVRLPCS